MRNRNFSLNIRINEKERDRLDKISHRCNLSKSAYIRMVINGYFPKESPPIAYHETIKELNYIGNNLNQIAKVANTTGIIDKNYYMEQSKKLEAEILKINKAVVIPERIDMLWLQRKSGA